MSSSCRPRTNVDPPLVLAGLVAPMIVSTRRRVVGLRWRSTRPHSSGRPGLITHDRRVAAAGATTTQGVQIELANLWQTASSSSRGGHRPSAWPGLSCWVVVKPPAGIEPATPSLPWNPRNRCAEPRFPRSRPTVRAKVIGSLLTKVCAHYKACAALSLPWCHAGWCT
jgi:hypothetical protein